MNVPLVIGTTGHSPEQRKVIENAARSIPIVLASNFSIGVNALFALTRAAGRILGPEFTRNFEDPSPNEEGCAKRNCENDCANSAEGARRWVGNSNCNRFAKVKSWASTL